MEGFGNSDPFAAQNEQWAKLQASQNTEWAESTNTQNEEWDKTIDAQDKQWNEASDTQNQQWNESFSEKAENSKSELYAAAGMQKSTPDLNKSNSEHLNIKLTPDDIRQVYNLTKKAFDTININDVHGRQKIEIIKVNKALQTIFAKKKQFGAEKGNEELQKFLDKYPNLTGLQNYRFEN